MYEYWMVKTNVSPMGGRATCSIDRCVAEDEESIPVSEITYFHAGGFSEIQIMKTRGDAWAAVEKWRDSGRWDAFRIYEDTELVEQLHDYCFAERI